jgi:hypothetical protein
VSGANAVIETSRLILRHFVEADLAVVAAQKMANPDFMHFSKGVFNRGLSPRSNHRVGAGGIARSFCGRRIGSSAIGSASLAEHFPKARGNVRFSEVRAG